MNKGNMQFADFNLISVLQHAAKWHGTQEVITHSVEGSIHRTNYSDVYKRTCQLANALNKLGVQSGDRVGTMGWNTWRHLECWYAISGLGAICHTINPRLFPNQIEFIVNHADDEFIFVDLTFVPVITGILDSLPQLKGLVVMTDEANMPELGDIKIPIYCYESLIEDKGPSYTWPLLDEKCASSLCYTSGTTGNPKGVLYTHRSNILHANAAASGDVFNLNPSSTILMVVPMFHANSWGIAYSAPMSGAKLVMPGPNMDGKSIYNLISKEEVSISAAVPTVWTGLLQYLDESELSVSSLKETVIGGSAVPKTMLEKFRDVYGVDVIHAWGMTETSPVGAVNRSNPLIEKLDINDQTTIRLKQGRPVYGIDMKIVDDEGNALAHDGESFGNLLVKGQWVIERYYLSTETAVDKDGWFDTGDIATIDSNGFMQITDRAKDLIKSGGEWISSVDIENTAAGHPDIAIAACIGIRHPKWEERPLLVAVKKDGSELTAKKVQDFIGTEHAKWQVPDDVIFVSEMPLTATGKLDKKRLRESYFEYYNTFAVKH